MSLRLKYASPEQDNQHFVPVLTSSRLKNSSNLNDKLIDYSIDMNLISLRLKRVLPNPHQ